MADLWEENQEFLKQSLGQSTVEMFGARWVLMPHVPVPRFNHVSMVRLEEERVPDFLMEARAFFRRRGLPACSILTTPATKPAGLADRLYAMGYTCETNPVMLWDGEFRPAVNPGVRVVVAPREQADLVFQLIRQIFFPDSSDPGAAYLRDGVEVSYNIGSLNYIAYSGENPVGVGSLFIRGEMGGIYNMGTLPAFRGRGIASTVMATCLEDAERLGCRYVGLTPTQMGRPLYESLGFREIYQERYFAQRFYP